MARRRFRRKDLKRPDEFVTRGRAALDWAQDNVRILAWGIGGLLAVVVIVAGAVSLRSARVRQANEDLDQALVNFESGSASTAAKQLADVASRWQSTAVGRIAGLYAANADVKAQEFDAARTRLQAALDEGLATPYLRQQALLDLGVALERKGDFTGAAGHYAEAVSIDGPYTGLALLGEARSREQAGERDKARALYERYVREFSKAPDVEVVQARIAALTG